MNGDGLQDHVAYKDYVSGDYGLSVGLSKVQFPFITSVTSGHGMVTTIEYKSLTDDSVYTKENTATFPVVDLQGPMFVVSAYETDNGVGGTTRMDYNYKGLKAKMDGRGFCGFSQISVVNDTTGIKTTTHYKQNHPYKTMAYMKEVRLADDTLVSRTEDIWGVINFTHGGYFPHVTQSVVDEFEITGTLINTTTTEKELIIMET